MTPSELKRRMKRLEKIISQYANRKNWKTLSCSCCDDIFTIFYKYKEPWKLAASLFK